MPKATPRKPRKAKGPKITAEAWEFIAREAIGKLRECAEMNKAVLARVEATASVYEALLAKVTGQEPALIQPPEEESHATSSTDA